ncbi:MAG: hypothetical protein AAFW75_28935 [Cyanobacteria bacterium J06636_16]
MKNNRCYPQRYLPLVPVLPQRQSITEELLDIVSDFKALVQDAHVF